MFLEYAKLNCSSKGKVAQRDSISKVLSVTNVHLAAAKREADQIVGNYEYAINELDNKIYVIKSEYEQQFNKLSRKHEAKYGHMMTSKYEQDISNLETWKTNRLKPLEERITILSRQMEEDGALKILQKKIDSLEGLSKNQHERLRGYEKEVIDIRKQIQVISSEMDEKLKQSSDKAKFMQQRKNVELNPCK